MAAPLTPPTSESSYDDNNTSRNADKGKKRSRLSSDNKVESEEPESKKRTRRSLIDQYFAKSPKKPECDDNNEKEKIEIDEKNKNTEEVEEEYEVDCIRDFLRIKVIEIDIFRFISSKIVYSFTQLHSGQFNKSMFGKNLIVYSLFFKRYLVFMKIYFLF